MPRTALCSRGYQQGADRNVARVMTSRYAIIRRLFFFCPWKVNLAQRVVNKPLCGTFIPAECLSPTKILHTPSFRVKQRWRASCSGDEDDDLEHFIEFRTVCLGEGAQEENNVVEVTAMNHQGKTTSVPIANLHIGCLPMVSLGEFELKAPVTVRLKAGSGPVTVSGLHLIASEVEESDLEEEEDEDEEEEEDDVSPIKPAKKKNKQLQ
ncbi:nucleoplasmin-3 isoform X1 [Vanacampus margaritifer]